MSVRNTIRIITGCSLALIIGMSAPAQSFAAPGDPIDNTSRKSVISAYRTWLKPTLKVPTGWTGNTAHCKAGDTSNASKTATLAAVNYMRAMAQLPPVTLNPDFSHDSQAAALIMSANHWLDHTPPKSAKCWTQAGYDGASSGNLFYGPPYGGELSYATGPRAIVGYMEDPGSGNGIVGHRRWIMYQQLTQIGTGDTTSANSLYVIDGWHEPTGTGTWVPWPTAGYFPRELEPNGRWSVSYPDANFKNAHVTVSTPNGRVSVNQHPVEDGYADNTLSWNMKLPSAYKNSTRDYPVTVKVTGIKMPDGSITDQEWTTVLVKAR